MNIQGTKQVLVVRNADLTGSRFDDVKLAQATFENTDMSGLRMRDVNLSNADIVDANLTGASIGMSTLTGMRIDGILVTELLRVYRAAGS